MMVMMAVMVVMMMVVVVMVVMMMRRIKMMRYFQGPLDNTCGDFWLMVWQQKTRAIVMLNRVIEKGTVSVSWKLVANTLVLR